MSGQFHKLSGTQQTTNDSTGHVIRVKSSHIRESLSGALLSGALLSGAQSKSGQFHKLSGTHYTANNE